MNFDANGMLPAGLHDYTVDQFIAQFVDGFTTSQTRRPIADSLFDFLGDVLSFGTPCEIWVDGSYVTAKINPNDADIALFLQIPTIMSLAPQWDGLCSKYAKFLDPYLSAAVSEENQKLLSPNDYIEHVVNKRNYWRGQFGFNRADQPKGIVRLTAESLQEYLKRR